MLASYTYDLFVINNYDVNCSLLLENPKASSQNIEDNFDGNLCRCTGKSY